MKKAFTIMEVLLVVILIGIVFGITLPNFNKMKEDNQDKKATSNLRLMQAAEKFYYVENSTYYPSAGTQADIATINTNLKLSLPTNLDCNNGTSYCWNYLVKNTGCVQATRNGGNNQQWYFLITDDDTTPKPNPGTCP